MITRASVGGKYMSDVIDYIGVLEECHDADYDVTADRLAPALEKLWIRAYRLMTPAENCVEMITWDSYYYVIDNTTFCYMGRDFVWDQDVEDRTVVVYGRSTPVKEKRDWNRHRGDLGAREWREDGTGLPYDRGHYIAHCIGGQEDIGLFPQRRDINRGSSSEGKLFRSMERYCFENPGLFCFSRPIFKDKSSHPFQLEYGVLKPDLTLWVERFPNRYTDKPFRSPDDKPKPT